MEGTGDVNGHVGGSSGVKRRGEDGKRYAQSPLTTTKRARVPKESEKKGVHPHVTKGPEKREKKKLEARDSPGVVQRKPL